MRRLWSIAALALTLAVLSACGGGGSGPVRVDPNATYPDPPARMGHYKVGKAYKIAGRWYEPRYDKHYDEVGVASWYGDMFHGLDTANGERFDKRLLTAAHTTMALPAIAEVTNLENGRRLLVRVNDRGPFKHGRIIDLSEAAAVRLGFHHQGLAKVRVRFLGLATAKGTPPGPLARFAGVEPSAAAPPAAPIQPVQPPAPQARTASSTTNACPRGDHFVHVASYPGSAGLDPAALAKAAGAANVAILPASTGGDSRARLGPLPDRGAAFDAVAKLRRLGYDEARVVSCA